MRYIALLMCLLIQVSVDAQSIRKIIVGRVLDKEATEREGKPIPFDVSSRYNTTRIYYFNTVQEGRKMCETLSQDTVRLISSAKYTVPDSLGFYKVVLSEKGSLVIKVGTASAVLEIVENRKEIVTYVEISRHLGEVTVIGKWPYRCWYPAADNSDPRRKRVPMRFLEYSFVPYELNPINYQEKPKIERRYTGTTDVFRSLTKDEILDRYRNDSDYHSGKKEFALSEYWHLFNMLEDPKELEVLYRRAYDYSKTIQEKPWILAANNLAVSYLKRDTVDIDILEPLINYLVRDCNMLRTNDGAIIGIDNVEQIVANQLEMYLKKGDIPKTYVLAEMLPEIEKYKNIKAFVLCLSGCYRESNEFSNDENKQRKEVFDWVVNSSPLNKVVMYLAMRRPIWNLKAEEALNDLPVDDAKTFYLKAILYDRKGEGSMASIQLLECFKKDKDYIPIAEFDADIAEACFIEAKKNYDRWNIAHK